MSAIPFVFEEQTHIYRVEGNCCLATSDVIQLAGLVDYDGVPFAVREHASWRGKQTHKAIHYFEEDDLDPGDLDEEILERFGIYLQWRKESGFIAIPPFERGIVYEHGNNLIGCHIDLRGYIPGKGLYVLDAKTSHPNSGQARKQTHLRWRMQLQSYLEATWEDEEFWKVALAKVALDKEPLQRGVLHLHPKAPQVFIDFPMDDSANWDACVNLAQLKLANGHKRPVHE